MLARLSAGARVPSGWRKAAVLPRANMERCAPMASGLLAREEHGSLLAASMRASAARGGRLFLFRRTAANLLTGWARFRRSGERGQQAPLAPRALTLAVLDAIQR